jgi:hypothetical protein
MQVPATTVDYGNMVHAQTVIQLMRQKNTIFTLVLSCGLLMLAWSGTAAGASDVSSSDPLERIEQAFGEKRLTFDEKVLLQATAIVSPETLPADFSAGSVSGAARQASRKATLVLLDMYNNRDRLSSGTRSALAQLLARPTSQKSWPSPFGFFRFHYDTSGPHQVPLADTNGNQIPDFVERCAAFCDTSLSRQLSFGYAAPPSDAGLGDDSLYDVYFREMSYYGYVMTDGSGPEPWNDAVSHMVLNRDFTEFPPNHDPEGDALGSARATCAHEFHHAIQYGYDIQEADWFMEFDATHMEELVFDQVDDNYIYLPDFLQSADESLMQSGTHSYGAFIWGLFLADQYDTTLIRKAWEGARYGNVFNSLSDSLWANFGVVLDSAFGSFAVWNYLTGGRDDGLHYAEGNQYPSVGLAGIHDVFPVDTTVCLCHPQGHAACYVQFLPSLVTFGRYRLEFDGADGADWLAYVVKSTTSNSHQIVQMALDPVTAYGYVDMESFQTYTSVVLVAVNISEYTAGASFQYWVHPSTLRAVSVNAMTPDSGVYSASSRRFEFEIDNPSPHGDLYEVQFHDDSGWVTPDTTYVYVPAGGSAVRSVKVEPPKGTPTGAPLGASSRIHVAAVSDYDPWVSDTISVPVHTIFQYGDIDFDGWVTMGDLTILIDHLFITLSPIQPVEETGNCDCEGIISMGDLTALISYLFIDPTRLLPCNPY